MEDRVYDRECTVEKLHSALIKPVKQLLSGSDNILICYEVKVIAKKIVPSWFDKIFSPTTTTFEAIVITKNQIINVGYGYDEIERKYGIENKSTKLTHITSVQEKIYSDMSIITVIGLGETEEPFIFSSMQNARKFANVLKQAIAQAKSGMSVSPQDKIQLADELSNVVEKTFQWNWPAKKQKGVVYARLDKEQGSLLLYMDAGLAVATGKGILPADVIAIWKELIGNFTIKGIPADEYTLIAKKEYGGRFGTKITHSDTSSANIAIFEDKPDGRLNVPVANFRVERGYERLYIPTASGMRIEKNVPSHRLIDWAVFYEYILAGRFNPEHIAYKMPLGQINIEEIKSPPK